MRSILTIRERGEIDDLDKKKKRNKWLKDLMKSFFISKVSKEAMTRGIANESAVISSLRPKLLVQAI